MVTRFCFSVSPPPIGDYMCRQYISRTSTMEQLKTLCRASRLATRLEQLQLWSHRGAGRCQSASYSPKYQRKTKRKKKKAPSQWAMGGSVSQADGSVCQTYIMEVKYFSFFLHSHIRPSISHTIRSSSTYSFPSSKNQTCHRTKYALKTSASISMILWY